MNAKSGATNRAGVLSLGLLICGEFTSSAGAIDNTKLLLHVESGVVSADISAAPLIDVVRQLEAKTGVTFNLEPTLVEGQTISAHFKNIALEPALHAIFKDANHAIVSEPTESGTNIQVHVTFKLTEAGKKASYVASRNSAPIQHIMATKQESPIDVLEPLDALESDPALRSQKLEETVALYGNESLGLVLEAAEDPNAEVQLTSERLLLTSLLSVVPHGVLSTVALRSADPANRLHALEALAGRDDELQHTRLALDTALLDTDPLVQQRAEELLQELPEPELAPNGES